MKYLQIVNMGNLWLPPCPLARLTHCKYTTHVRIKIIFLGYKKLVTQNVFIIGATLVPFLLLQIANSVIRVQTFK